MPALWCDGWARSGKIVARGGAWRQNRGQKCSGLVSFLSSDQALRVSLRTSRDELALSFKFKISVAKTWELEVFSAACS